ncbi:hypothetical protein Tco_0790504 [Tanacetum coccineum]
MLRCMDGQIVTEPVQRKAPGNNGNTGTRGKKVICYNCRGEGHIAEESIPRDVECTAPYDQPQALTTTNMFQANHEDAYDSDVDEGPNAAVAFMANLSSTNYRRWHRKNIRLDVRLRIDDNTIPFHQYLIEPKPKMFQLRRNMLRLTRKMLEIETLKNELLQCKQEICRLDTHKVKLDLEHKVRQEQALVIQRNKRNAELVQENDFLEQSFRKRKSIAFLQSEKEKIYLRKRKLG